MVDGFIKDSSKTNPHRKKVVSSHVHRRTQKAKTLMRSGLKKPIAASGQFVKHPPGFRPEREMRAKATPKHNRVDHFGMPTPRQKTAPTAAVSGELMPAKAGAGQVYHPSSTAPLPSIVTCSSHLSLERLLDQALTHADTHREAIRYQAARHFWHRRWLGGNRKWLVLAGVLIAVLAGLLISWQKVPALSVKMAGFRAHVKSAVPVYIPDGFHLAGPAKATSGTVNISYVSNTSIDRYYDIVQAQSNLTSQSVEQNVVPKGATVQTSQVDGNTVYIYGRDNDAAWVNNGVLYTINDHANLSSDELIKIVQGLNQ
jgi:hypothetical protein